MVLAVIPMVVCSSTACCDACDVAESAVNDLVPSSMRRSTIFASSDAQPTEAEVLQERGFHRMAPVLMACEAGSAKGRALRLQPGTESWEKHEWQLGEDLLPLDLIVAQAGCRLRQIGSTFTIASTGEGEPVWVGLDARQQGAGVASCAEDDEFLISGTRVRVLSVPTLRSPGPSSPLPSAGLSPKSPMRAARFSTADPRLARQAVQVDSPLMKRASIVAQAVQASAQEIGRKVLRFAPTTKSTEYSRVRMMLVSPAQKDNARACRLR